MTTTLPEQFDAVCERNADRLAIIDEQVRLTFADVADAVRRFAAALAAEGIEPGDVVSWQLPNWWEAVVIHHGILRAGAIPNPVNPALRARELLAILEEARPVLLITPGTWRGVDMAAQAKQMRDRIGLRTMVVRDEACTTMPFEPLVTHPESAPVPASRPGDIALLLYTSGTTSTPKGVQHTHAGLMAEIGSFTAIHGLTQDDRLLGGAPVTHIAGLAYGVLAPFVLGTSTVLLERWDPSRALHAIATEGATFMTGPPTFLHTLASAAAGADTSSFRLFSTGGASIASEQIREAAARLGCTVKRAYGSTEMPTLTACTLDDDEQDRLTTDGRVIGGAQMRVVRADGTEAPPGADGEIWARGPELFAGYRSGDRSAFTDDGWFRTGDIGCVDARGYLRVTGRLKDIIIRGGENISAAELEALLLQHPGVEDVAVVGIADERLGERVCAVVVSHARPALHELTAFLRARDLATYKLPESVEYVEALPRTDSGKVRKTELRELIERARQARG